jgi:hypothetical protein
MIRRIAVATALFVVAVAVVGCGGSTSETAKVEDVVIGYFGDLAEGDGASACERLSGEEARGFYTEIAEEVPELQATSCPDLIDKLAENLGAAEKEQLEEVEIDEAKIEGNSATVTIVGAERPAKLTHEGDRWLITGGLTLGG